MNISLLATILIALVMLLIISSLGVALYHLIRGPEESKGALKALSVRIILSFALFIALFIAFAMGWIAPHSLFSAR